MTLLKTYYCCFSLRTGSINAAILGIILGILGIVLVFTANIDFKTIVIDWLPKWIVNIIIVINFAMTILISMLLLIGIIKRNVYLMMPWVILGIMLAIGLLVSVIYTSVNFYIEGESLAGTLMLVLGLLSIVKYIYMWMVTYSFFQIVKEEYDRRAAYERAPFRRQY
ncbi:PREDICTED: uncharacterized protein LOC108567852 [Nicrophorus vespilloides]|uniref:Uncharacterized protein LOC108567852 n=1 Tax=Nicrophorus vespilloides TaxID=110193 RepID=A0ABM1NB45_NICVS|nr:PREDICTED: uncharacterized protein LOC108567852 [Nicrophorus vespilloides]